MKMLRDMSGNAKLYLFPVTMGDSPVAQVIPAENLRLLHEVRYFIVENIRSARRFLKCCDRSIDIDGLSFTELNEHTPSDQIAAMLDPMADGHSVGIISEAGCPAIADPGADIVAIAQLRGYEIVPLVGPSSIILSLMGSGFNGQNFAFNGYLPIDQSSRVSKLKDMERRIKNDRQTQIFIETPYRNNRLLEELVKVLPGDMLLCVASDITGSRQSIITRRLSQWKNSRWDYNRIPTIFLLFS